MRYFFLLFLLWPTLAITQPLITGPASAPEGDPVTAQVTGLDPSVSYWVTLIHQTALEGTWKEYVYINGATEAEVTLTAPGSGQYEFRLHDKIEPYSLYARTAITLTGQTYGPPAFRVSGDFATGKTTVRISGLHPDIRYWVTFVPASEPLGTWAQYHYIQSQTEAEVTFNPVANGAYQLRLHDRAPGYELYLTQDATVQGNVAPPPEPAPLARAFTGPCPEMSNADSGSVAACLTHLETTSVRHVFTNATSTCRNMQFQLILAQENKEGTRQNLRGVDMAEIEEVDCKMIARQVETVFGQMPTWARCTDHPADVSAADHIACVVSTPIFSISRNALSPENVRNGVNRAYPVTCEGLRQRLLQAYGSALENLFRANSLEAVFPADMNCEPYEAYLIANEERRTERIAELDGERAERIQEEFQRQQASAAMLDAVDAGYDQMESDGVAARAARVQDAGSATAADLRWALVKVLHRLEPEYRYGARALVHTSNGLRQRAGRGVTQIISTHVIDDLRIRSCTAAADGVQRCDVEVTVISGAHAPGDQGASLLLSLSGGVQRSEKAFIMEVRFVGSQWEVATITNEVLDVIWSAPQTQATSGFDFGGYSPEECLWLRSMGASGLC